jgi:hypothetical protein
VESRDERIKGDRRGQIRLNLSLTFPRLYVSMEEPPVVKEDENEIILLEVKVRIVFSM